MQKGNKNDQGKLRWDLLPWAEVKEIVKVLTFGAKKYADNNWQLVPDARARYFAAIHRHLEAWHSGEVLDKESGLPHLAHTACCLLFLLWNEARTESKSMPETPHKVNPHFFTDVVCDSSQTSSGTQLSEDEIVPPLELYQRGMMETDRRSVSRPYSQQDPQER